VCSSFINISNEHSSPDVSLTYGIDPFGWPLLICISTVSSRQDGSIRTFPVKPSTFQKLRNVDPLDISLLLNIDVHPASPAVQAVTPSKERRFHDEVLLTTVIALVNILAYRGLTYKRSGFCQPIHRSENFNS